MKNVQKIDLGLTGYDELFANDEERKVNKLPRIFDIPISEIDDFPDHPFKVKIDEDMDQLVQSNKGSSGPQDGESDHTGIVERVEDGIVYTVEGNSGDSCRENHYAVGYYEILGYGIPAY